MQTSNFSTHSRLRFKNAVAISRQVPADFNGRTFSALAPSEQTFLDYKRTRDAKSFAAAYNLQLSKLDPAAVLKDLGNDAVLLCFEEKGAFCHRRLVADWISSKLGLNVPEHAPRKPAMTPLLAESIDKAWR